MRRLLKLFLLASSLLVAGAMPAIAQAPPDSGPPPAAEPDDGPTGENTFRAALESLAFRTAQLLPQLEASFERPLRGYLLQAAWYLLWAVAGWGLLRNLRSNEGANFDTGMFFLRLGLCITLMLSTNGVWDWASSIGRAVASGTSVERPGYLRQLMLEQRNSFDASYAKFVENQFTVKTPDGDVPVPSPGDASAEGILGVIFSKDAKLEEASRLDFSLDQGAWLPWMFESLSFSRAVLELGDLFLIIIGYFVAMIMRLTAPFFVALAVDRAFSSRASANFAWGAVVCTMVLPVVAQILRILAYMCGNLGLAVGDQSPIYRWDPVALGTVTMRGSSPFFTVAFASAMMLVASLMLFGAPYLAYKLSTGQVYEAASALVAGWTGAIISTGVELRSTAAAAAINRQAETTQVAATAEAGGVEAKASRDAGLGRNNARLISGEAAIWGSAVGAARSTIAQSNAAASSILAGGRGAARQTLINTGQAIADNNANAGFATRQSVVDSAFGALTTSGESERMFGRAAAGYSGVVGQGGGAVSNGNGGPGGGVAGTAGAGVSLIAGASSTYLDTEGAVRQIEIAQGAQNKHLRESNANVASRTAAINENVAVAGGQIAEVQVATAREQAGAVAAGGRQAAGAILDGARQSIGGLKRGKALEDKAVETEYAGRTSAIEIVENAGREAATLRAKAHLTEQFGRSVARRIDEADELRY